MTSLTNIITVADWFDHYVYPYLDSNSECFGYRFFSINHNKTPININSDFQKRNSSNYYFLFLDLNDTTSYGAKWKTDLKSYFTESLYEGKGTENYQYKFNVMYNSITRKVKIDEFLS